MTTSTAQRRPAAEVVRRYYRSNLAVTIKADKSPVTEADVETERTIRGIIAARDPRVLARESKDPRVQEFFHRAAFPEAAPNSH